MPKFTLNNIGNLSTNSASTQINENFQTIVNQFDNVVSRNGANPSAMTADLDMNSNQILNLPDATTDQEPLTYGQFNVYYADILSKANQVTADKLAVENLYDQFDDRYLGSKAVAPTNDNDGNALLVGAIYWDNVKQNLYFWNGSAWESPVEECLAILDNFDDIYLGAKASDPVTDNDGDPLNEGDVYWNSVTKKLKVYNGSSWTEIALYNQSLNTTDSVTFAGLTVNGNVSVTGTVDGRDVSVDGSKLDGIEAGADVTDTTNVTAAGALMDSELTSLSGVKTLTVPDNTTISTFGASLVDDVDAATARTTLGVDPAGTDNSTDVTLAGTGTYLSILGQVITVDPITESDISDLGAYLENVVEDTTPQLGGNLDMNGHNITASGGTATSISHTGSGSLTVSAANGGLNLTTTQSNANITINPHGTGNVLVGNYTFDGDQTVGAGQDNYVLTYDNASGLISLEASAGDLNGLSDVTLSSLGPDELLFTQDGSTFINQTLAEAGISAVGHTHTASEITDFDTEVSNNTDVAANTAARHAAVTFAGTGTYISLSGQQITVDPITESDITDLGTYIENVVEDATPQLGGSLDVNGQKIVSVSNGDIDIEPDGTGNVLIGNFKFDADQTIGAGQDDYVLTYDNASGLISLEEVIGGVESVNSQTGVVVLDADDIDDTSTTNKFTTATSVTAAGAVMDSELTSLSGIKTLTVPDNTTISSFGATLIDDADASAARTTLGVGSTDSPTFAGITVGSVTTGTVREVLTADRTYYVRTDGSDSNDGLANSSGGAFLTIQKALNTTATIDFNGYTVTIQVGNGTYASSSNIIPTTTGQKTVNNLIIQGDTSTPSNVIIQNSSAYSGALATSNGASATIRGFEIQSSTANTYGISAVGGYLLVSSMLFSGNDYANAIAEDGTIVFNGNYEVSGAPTRAHWAAYNGGILRCQGRTITITGTPDLNIFADADAGGVILSNNCTFSGAVDAATQKYFAQRNGVIRVFGSGINYFPGGVAGITVTGGQYG